MTDVEALARYVHELHVKLGKLLIRDLNDATDAWYKPHPGGLLEAYLLTVDEVAERFGISAGRSEEYDADPHWRFYPPKDAGTDET